jgi:hypothetical protein
MIDEFAGIHELTTDGAVKDDSRNLEEADLGV